MEGGGKPCHLRRRVSLSVLFVWLFYVISSCLFSFLFVLSRLSSTNTARRWTSSSVIISVFFNSTTLTCTFRIVHFVRLRWCVLLI